MSSKSKGSTSTTGKNTRSVMTKNTIRNLKGISTDQKETKKHSTVEGKPIEKRGRRKKIKEDGDSTEDEIEAKPTKKRGRKKKIKEDVDSTEDETEGIYLSSVNECEEDNEIIVQWKQQHPDVTKSQQTLCELIEVSEIADEMFVLNFITLFVNTMIEKKACGGLHGSQETKAFTMLGHFHSC
ncbi:unnamed protein product [Lactuca saligna]|uniref:Uncharacterized protein n=1 Tax=Lactuca saligna TaxID=75948 RepID=A0AA35Z2U1_LACSI|nr:unnamed protein product [Lactuca saligna]